MAAPISGYGLYDALKDEGFTLPDDTADVKLTFPVDGIVQLLLVINVTDEKMDILGRALCRLAKEGGRDLQKSVARDER